MRITARSAKVNRAGQDALVPEAVDFRAWFLAEEYRCHAFYRNNLKAPGGAEYPKQRQTTRNHQHKALASDLVCLRLPLS